MRRPFSGPRHPRTSQEKTRIHRHQQRAGRRRRRKRTFQTAIMGGKRKLREAVSLKSLGRPITMKRAGIAFALAGIMLAAGNVSADPPADEALCSAGSPSLPVAMEVSERVVLYVVTAVVVDTDPLPADETELMRGTFELTPLATLKGQGEATRTSVRFDATLYPELFGGPPCRWSVLPVKGEIWIATGSRDGEDCVQCDGRLDAVHKLGGRGPLSSFTR